MTRCKLLSWFHLNSPGFNLNSPGFHFNSPGFSLNSPGFSLNCLGFNLNSIGFFPKILRVLSRHPPTHLYRRVQRLKVLNKYRKISQTGCKSKHKFVLPVVGSLRSDSALNSLDFWDYSVELDCLQGPEGSQTLLIIIIQ
jgi:hypothetical protein